MKRNIYELIEIEKKKGKLTMKEKRRLKIFHEKAKILEKLWTGKCKVCNTPIHKDAEFCSSECYRKDKKLPTRLEQWRLKRERQKIRQTTTKNE